MHRLEMIGNIYVNSRATFLLTIMPAPTIIPMRKLGTNEATTIIRLSMTEMEVNMFRQKNT